MISLSSIGKRSTWVRFKKAVQLLGGVMGLLLLCLPSFSQGILGRITGTITDQSGGVVSGATVTVVDTDRGISKTLVTNDVGEYNAPSLNPGKYKVRAEAKGFKTIERENIVLEVGKEIRADMALVPGAVAETMTITEAVPMVETTNATLGGTLNNADINDMPLNGRNYQSLMTLRPGVVSYAGGGPWTQSTNNIRPDESSWMLDGIINVNFYDARPIANMPSPITDAATILPIDAIQEFNMEENPKAEFGWKPGAVVNVGVKSGTNALHGSAYGFYRSAAWDARDLFNPAPVGGVCIPNPAVPAVCDKAPTQLKQFGGVVGGPIKKDKLFFFGGYEGLRSIVGNAIPTTIPETGSQGAVGTPAADPKHSMADAIMALQAAKVARSTLSETILGCTEPNPGDISGTVTLPTCTGNPVYGYSGAQANSINFLSNFPNTNISNNGVGKIDYHINSKNTLNGMVLISRYVGSGEDHPFVNKIYTDSIPIPTYSVRADWIWTPNSRLVNDMKFGYDSVTFDFVSNDGSTLADGKGYPLNTGATEGGFPTIRLKGFGVSHGFQLGTWHNRPNHFHTPYFDGQDSVSYLVGKHTLKFGGEIAHIQVQSQSKDTARGQIDFSSLRNFFSGDPSKGQLFVNARTITLNWMSYAGFVQDDWRVTPKLTLNLGLRYSYVSPMKEADGLVGSFDPAKGMVEQSQLGGTLWKPDRKNFSPRVGFAWDVTGKGTTVVRGGFSIMYSVVTAGSLLAQGGLQNTTGASIALVPTGACTTFVLPPATCPATFGGTITSGISSVPGSVLHWKDNSPTVPLFPNAPVNCDAAAKHLCNLMSVDPNLLTPYVTNYSLGVQHAFSNDLSLEVEYVGNRGSRLTGFTDLNQPNITAGTGSPYAAKFPYLNFINNMSNDSHSKYNSLQATLTKRISHGISFLAGYTYGHGLDNGSLNRNGFLPQDSYNPGAEYASGDFDTRHRFTFTTSYDIPGIKGYGQLLEGWKLNSIVTLQSALPWLVDDSNNDFAGAGEGTDRWNFFGNPADFKSGMNSIPFCTGPGNGGCSSTSGIYGSTLCGAAPGTGLNGACDAATSTAMWSKCTAVAPDPTTLAAGGCFVSGNSVMAPPKTGTFGTMGRNIFRDTGYKNVDFSVFKTFTFKERFSAQFRAELFNLFNHPVIANPFGSVGGSPGNNDPSAPGNFGCGCSTPDVAAGNPIVGSGSARALQVGLKLKF